MVIFQILGVLGVLMEENTYVIVYPSLTVFEATHVSHTFSNSLETFAQFCIFLQDYYFDVAISLAHDFVQDASNPKFFAKYKLFGAV